MENLKTVPFLKSLASILISCCAWWMFYPKRLSNSVQKPTISVQDVRVTDFNFQEMELTYDVVMNNPNAVSMQMLGYDYNLNTNETTLVSGQQGKKLTIDASGKAGSASMTIKFRDLYTAITQFDNTGANHPMLFSAISTLTSRT
ncbi:MAG: hypothetical protein U5J63_10085 [Fodinibius sp.]|nr:hypothetical protein [Fodinibius sp.]